MREFDLRTTSNKESVIMAQLASISPNVLDEQSLIKKIDLYTPTFPLKVQIQTSTRCNAACGMCPYPEITGEEGFRHKLMDESLFLNILRQLQGRGVQRLALFLMNEPLLDKRLPNWIQRARKQLPTTELTLFSNGSALTEKMLHRLVDAGLDELTVSVHGFEAQTYERVMKNLKYERLLRNLHGAVDAYNNGQLADLKLHFVTGDIDEISLDTIPPKFAPFVNTKSFSNERAAAETTIDLPSSPFQPSPVLRPLCQRPFVKLYILTSGECVLCNVDWRHSEILGDLSKEDSIEQIWNGARYKNIRLQHLRRSWQKEHICTRCDYPLVVNT